MKSIGRAWTRSSSNSGRRWIAWVEIVASPARFREFVPLRCRPLIQAIGPAGETACPTLLDQSFGEVGGAGGFACRWTLISIAHPNPENCHARPAITPGSLLIQYLRGEKTPRPQFSRSQRLRDGRLRTPPFLAIEILSKTDR